MSDFDRDLDAAAKILVEEIYKKAQDFPDEYNELPGVQAVDEPTYNTEDGYYFWDPESLSTMKQSIETIVAKRLEPWRNMPSPEGMSDPVASLDSAMKSMAGSGSNDVYHGSKGNDPSAFDVDSQIDLVENTGAWSNDITKYMSRVNLNVSGWRGATISAFKETYVRRFSPMYKLQFNAVSILKLFLELEQDLWQGVRKDVIEVIEITADSYSNLSTWGGSGSRNLMFNFYTVIVGVWGAIVAGPVGAIVSVVVSGAIGQMKDEAPQATSPPVLDGDTLIELWDSFGSALKSLRNEAIEVESNIGKALNGVFELYHSPVKVDQAVNDAIDIRADLLVRMPPPNRLVEDSVDTNKDGFVSQDEMIEGVERPEEGYHRPAGETA